MAHEMDTYGLYDLTASSGDEKPSILYAVLPKIVKTRLRRIPSLRRSFSQYALGTQEPFSSPGLSRRTSRTGSELQTPPPGYQSRMSLSEQASDSEEDAQIPLRPLSSCSSEGPVESESGILWKFANQGLSLLNLAAQEDYKQAFSKRPTLATSLSRQLYVHGVTYMLRGLPADLTADEKMSVWSAIPPDVQQIAPITSNAILIPSPRSHPDTGAPSPKQPTLLQQAVAALIVQLFVLTQFFLPYAKYCVSVLYRYERRHKISEKVLANGMQACEGMMKTGLKVSDSICRMNDGKVGQVLGEMSVWWVSGITAGIQQGVGEGLAVLEVQATNKGDGMEGLLR